MRFAHILEAVYPRPWNITPAGWLSVHQLLQSRLFEEAATDARLDFSAFVNPRPEMEIDGNGIAHVHVTGVLGKNLSQIEKACGNTGYEQIESEVTQAVDDGARGILLHVNSPGGAAVGNIETAQAIVSAGVPTAVFSDELNASAAYALSAGAGKFTVTPSAEVGGIGTILPLVDSTGAWEMRGVKPAYITHTGGDLKDAFWPPSFTDAHRQYFQETVDDYFGQFRDHVLAHRHIAPAAMRGQTYVGPRAKEANLVDAVSSYDDAYQELLSRVS